MLAEERVAETEGKQRDRERVIGQVVISSHVGWERRYRNRDSVLHG